MHTMTSQSKGTAGIVSPAASYLLGVHHRDCALIGLIFRSSRLALWM